MQPKAVVATLLLWLANSAALAQSPSSPGKIRVNGVDLHYLERGKGEPIVFVHGGLADYREWGPVAEGLADQYRTITYSRRYNHPNDNALVGENHSALVEAEDLAGLVRGLGLGPVHVVGASYGGYTALLLGLRHPELVRTLVLAEPALISWLPGLPGGAAVHAEFMDKMWMPAGRAFRAGKKEEALRVTVEYFMGPGAADQIPPEFRAMLHSNAREWEALTTSKDAFPHVPSAEVRKMKAPSLMLSGGRTNAVARIVDRELARVLPRVERKVIQDGSHDMCAEQPPACAEAIRAFLVKR